MKPDIENDSIVEQAISKAQKSVMLVLVGATFCVCLLLAERATFQADMSEGAERLAFVLQNANNLLLTQEKLAMSARLAAETGGQRWVDRYDANLPASRRAIENATKHAPPAIASEFEQSAANTHKRLMRLDAHSFDEIEAGDLDAAREILESVAYNVERGALNLQINHFIEQMIGAVRNNLFEVKVRGSLILSVGLMMFFVGGIFFWRSVTYGLNFSKLALVNAENKIRNLATFDELTGLLNRNACHNAMHKIVTHPSKSEQRVAVLLIDLDKFKPVNDRYGHDVGDAVLREAASRLHRTIEHDGLCARYGGDEFICLVPAQTDEEVQDMAFRIIERISAPILVDDISVKIGASIGVTIFPDHGEDEKTLFRQADIALYKAKSSGRGAMHYYDAEMDAVLAERTIVEQELRAAILGREIVPYFQPIIDMKTNKVRCLEVLSRWNHPTRGLLAPDHFIEIAETTRQIADLTLSVLEQACEQLKDFPDDISLAVNIYAGDLKDRHLFKKFTDIIERTGIRADRVEFELTENAVVDDFDAARLLLDRLQEIGVKVALDDFGVGYSSLSYLTKLHFDKIKIDRCFVINMLDVPENEKIINATIGMARSLNVATVAEGIELPEHQELLRAMGCDYAQGYLYSRPRPADEILRFVADMNIAKDQRIAS